MVNKNSVLDRAVALGLIFAEIAKSNLDVALHEIYVSENNDNADVTDDLNQLTLSLANIQTKMHDAIDKKQLEKYKADLVEFLDGIWKD